MKARASDALMVPPRTLRSASGAWKLPARILLTGGEADRLALETTAALLERLGREAEVAIDGPEGDIRIVRDSGVADAEGYKLSVTGKGVRIAASTAAGAFYGCCTLRELLRAGSGKTLACMSISDVPAFARRAVYHDTARGKVPTLETLKGLVDRLAEWKINELQLYVENAFEFRAHPAIHKGYSPLTAVEMVELREYCRERHMKFVPSLSSFGHMEKVLRLPQYAHLNEVPYGSTLCPSDPGSIKFVAELYEEFLPLFDKGDFNVCCDETWDIGKGRTRELCRKVGGGKVYMDFLLKIRKLCRKHGFRMNAWADIVLKHPELLDSAPRDIVMLNWDYAAEGNRIPRTKEIAEAGFPFMICPGASTWSSMGSRWPNASANIRNFAAVGAKYGAEGVLNTDWGDGNHRQPLAISLMGLAFGAAESWNPGKTDMPGFHRIFARQAFLGDKALGDAILALGRIDDLGDIPIHGRNSFLYYTLDQALTGSTNEIWYDHGRGVDKRPPELINAILDLLPDEAVWKIPTADRFDGLCMADYAMVARLTALYCLRGSISWQLGMGEKVSKNALNNLADCVDAVGKDYSALWLARNKSSRLGDFMKLFKAASAEARKLAKK